MALGNTMTPHPSRSPDATEARRYRFQLPASAVCVALARHRAGAQLDRWGLTEERRDVVVLVISELVTNAIVHTTSTSIVCELHDRADVLRVEVQDQGGGRLVPDPRRATEEECGRGLLLVEELTTAWGVEDSAHGTRVVWADVPRTAELP